MDATTNISYINGRTEKLLLNGLLFCELRGHSNTVDKLKNIEDYIKNGADVNAPDANDDNNTPLHIAIQMDEPDLVKVLLKYEANVNKKNKNMQSPLDLALICNNKNKIQKSNILRELLANRKEDLQLAVGKTGKKELVEQSILQNETNVHKKQILPYKSRPGTAGIRGQLYESKLIALLLHRALNDKDIVNFYLDSNVPGLGAFDDIVFKYHLKNDRKPKILFMQAKHKDDPAKARLTLDSVRKSNDDFSLDKYFESYITIEHKVKTKKGADKILFQNKPDCCFIIYTPAIEQFDKKSFVEVYGKETLTLTNDKWKIFKYKYDDEDIEILLKNVLKSRAHSLAQKFARSIARQNYENMMWDDLIKVYHVFLINNVVKICCVKEKCLSGNFRKSFLESKDEILVLMKETMFKELKMLKKLPDKSSEITFEFQLPKNFGNANVSLKGCEYIDKLCEVFDKIMRLREKNNNIGTIEIDDSMIGNSGSFHKTDIAMIGDLVGETLVFDIETGFLKLYTEDNASNITKKVLDKVKLFVPAEKDVNNLRFDITIQNFPQVSLCNLKLHRKMLKDFLEKLMFFTGQADEEGVENILKNEIHDKYISERNENEYFYSIKDDAIYLQYHDIIQKWWKSGDKKYLTETCKFYEESKKIITDSPMINVLSYVYVNKICSYNMRFNQESVNYLNLLTFMNNMNISVLHISSKDKTWTSIKVFQFFNDNQTCSNFVFIDFDLVNLEVNVEVILKEISNTQKDVAIILVLNDVSNISSLFFQCIQNNGNKIIVLSHSGSLNIECKNTFLVQMDQNNSLNDLDTETKQWIYLQKKVLLQGFEVSFTSIIDKSIEKYLNKTLLHTVINSNIIQIGKELKHVENYFDNRDVYINRYLCRCLKVNGECRSIIDIFEPKDSSLSDTKWVTYENQNDVLIISCDETVFEEVCKKKNNVNVHWFRRKDSETLQWMKSYGNLQKLLPYIQKIQCTEKTCCSFAPKTLKDVKDKIVVICGEPGMGKSSLLTHLMIQTKLLHKSSCVIKLSLLDLTNDFSSWHEYNTGTRLKWLMLLLYRAFSLNNADLNSSTNKVTYEKFSALMNYLLVEDDNRVYLNCEDGMKNISDFNVFELRVFLNMYNNEKIFVILDGFDEVCPDYKKESIELFEELIKSRTLKLWISSRSYLILNELELQLNTIAYTLKSLSTTDQIIFLKKIWNTNCRERNKSIDFYVKYFLNAISLKIKDYRYDFTATPLHLHMIAETYETSFNSFYSSSPPLSKKVDYCNLITLYKKFIEIKFYKIRFGEKRNCLCDKDPDIKVIIELARNAFLENHKILSAYALLHNNNEAGLLNEGDLTRSQELIQRFNRGEEKTGIVSMIYQNLPRFVHFTYAEYFFSEFICDKLKQNNESAWKYINHCLVNDKQGIRSFFDAKLEVDKVLSKLTSKTLCDTLLSHSTSKSALNYAVSEFHTNIALFLLNNLDSYLNVNNLDDFINLVSERGVLPCFLECTHDERNLIVLNRIIKIIIRLDCSKLDKLFFIKDNPICNIYLLVFLHQYPMFQEVSSTYKVVMDMMVQHIETNDLTSLLVTPLLGLSDQTVLHFALINRTKMQVLENIIKKLNSDQCMTVLSVKDEVTGRTPAHNAALYSNIEFFYFMASLVNKEQFKTICTARDVYGHTPLMYFTIDKKRFQVIQSLEERGKVPLNYFNSPSISFNEFRCLCDKADIRIIDVQEQGEIKSISFVN